MVDITGQEGGKEGTVQGILGVVSVTSVAKGPASVYSPARQRHKVKSTVIIISHINFYGTSGNPGDEGVSKASAKVPVFYHAKRRSPVRLLNPAAIIRSIIRRIVWFSLSDAERRAERRSRDPGGPVRSRNLSKEDKLAMLRNDGSPFVT
ncbi:Protein of unknown function [Pyronema omphalodes CBS 100304]|uniref:Uncharacterized protein n=1 Tax=Pyronema omphalodes (strain CBS 100304) TaxID=1076935 RepID=U4L8C7_PYROM|nr:Protein of unknown function [Pyronema omphalodes CBS 100304]